MTGYHLILTPDDNGTLLVTSPDFPELASYGADRADALSHGRDALESVVGWRMTDGMDIPPEAQNGDVRLPLLSGLKVVLYRAMRTFGVDRAELARRLSWPQERVDEVLSLEHPSDVADLEEAMAAVGTAFAVGMDLAVA